MGMVAEIVSQQKNIYMGEEEMAASQSPRMRADRTKHMFSVLEHTWQEMINTINSFENAGSTATDM